jgi:hypothetical protein
LASKCSHEDTRLTCVECSAPICTQCLVECPVGFRCKSCVGSVKNPLTAVTPILVVKTAAMCAGIGFGAGWIMQFINVPYISCIICYFLGLFTGRWLANVIDYRLGDNVGKIIVIGLLIGMCFTPLILGCFFTVEMLIGSMMGHVPTFERLYDAVSYFFCPVCFFVGVLRPTVWGDRW